jgi:hypothetical protein
MTGKSQVVGKVAMQAAPDMSSFLEEARRELGRSEDSKLR